MTNIDYKQFTPSANSWPFEEARKLVKRFAKNPPKKGYALFQTGYGPSGLPHIGTFGEVMRTSLVRRAFELISDIPTRLFCFSDDMDGLRKVPDNVPNREMLAKYLGLPLTKVPDPFELYPSFGEHNNAMLRRFLDNFGFEYEFKSATQEYKSGAFDKTLLIYLENFEKIQEIMLPTLGEDRQANYAAFLPICAKTGKVLYVKLLDKNVAKGTMTYQDETGEIVETSVLGGACKLQWKPDWGMRWHHLEVDYEMSGKDLIPTAELSAKIVRACGGQVPEIFHYELFLDEKGQKISKSKGNGISIDDWLKYASPESLAYFMYQKPKTAKRMYFDVIPKNYDEYFQQLKAYPSQNPLTQLDNPIFHLHYGAKNPVPSDIPPLNFSLILNLVGAANTESADILWGFIHKYNADITPQNSPSLDQIVGYAIKYYHDMVKPLKKYKNPSDIEKSWLQSLADGLADLPDYQEKSVQEFVFEIGKTTNLELKDWFKLMYEVLLGQETGPRMGSFFAIFGRENSVNLIRKKIA